PPGVARGRRKRVRGPCAARAQAGGLGPRRAILARPAHGEGGGLRMRLPLEGIRVIEIAHYVAVPAAGALLADLGADVVKVEQPPRGEIYRRARPRYAGYASDFPESPGFHLDNRGKRSLM